MNNKNVETLVAVHSQAILWKGGAYVLNSAPLLNLQEMEVQC